MERKISRARSVLQRSSAITSRAVPTSCRAALLATRVWSYRNNQRLNHTVIRLAEQRSGDSDGCHDEIDNAHHKRSDGTARLPERILTSVLHPAQSARRRPAAH